MKNNQHWTSIEINYLKKEYGVKPNFEIAKYLNRTISSIDGKIARLKLSKGYDIHGHTNKKIPTKTYNTWQNMKKRCHYKKHHKYKDYGGRGIIVCTRWFNSFNNFKTDMGERPENTTIDRIDNDQGYYLDNCRWASPKQQANNKRYKNKGIK